MGSNSEVLVRADDDWAAREHGYSAGSVFGLCVECEAYPAFQQYFREAQPPLLAIWGKYDPFFIPAGAEAYQRDNANARVKFLGTGHFATETHAAEIATAMREFLGGKAGL